jgi:transglutaminase-like putative cysteine protease
LNKEYQRTDIWGNREATIEALPAKNILTLEIEKELPAVSPAPVEQVVTSATYPVWRVGENKGLPDPDIIKQIKVKIAQLETQLAQVEEQLNNAQDDPHFLQHRYYVLERELYELRLSALLNRRKLALQGSLDYEYLYTADPEIAELGMQLNELRIKRRIYDYVVGALSLSRSSDPDF